MMGDAFDVVVRVMVMVMMMIVDVPNLECSWGRASLETSFLRGGGRSWRMEKRHLNYSLRTPKSPEYWGGRWTGVDRWTLISKLFPP